MSFASEVIADSTGTWSGNALRFATREEAESYVRDLSWRWLAVRETRVVESADAVNSSYAGGVLKEVTAEPRASNHAA